MHDPFNPMVPPRNGTKQSDGLDWTKIGSCSAASHYGLTAATGVSGLLALPIPKAIVPPYKVIGTPTTNILSILGRYVDISVPSITIAGRTSENLLRIPGRANPYVFVGLLAIDAGVIGYGTYNCYQQSGQPAGPTSDVYNGNNQINGISYDMAGDQLSVNGDTLSYDAENRQIQVTEPPSLGNATESYYYDGNGQRVQKSGPAGTTVYVYDGFGQLAAEYSTDPGGSPCTTCYLSYDHLGSVRLVTDQNANVVSRHDYLPFGEEVPSGTAGRTGQWGAADNTSQRFTGQIRDQETGLDYFNARYYGAALGRFTSPDPMGMLAADPTNPQSWNQYSYVWNNPLVNTDPSGKTCIYDDSGNAVGDDGDGEGCGDVGVAPGTLDQNGQPPPGQNSPLNQGQVNAQATAQNPSDLEYWWTIATNEIPFYVENDLPLNPQANTIIQQVANKTTGFPDICSGGAFAYAGVQGKKRSAHGFGGYLGNYDTKSGWSNNFLGEGSGKTVGLGGATNFKNNAEGLAFIPTAEAGGVVVGISKQGLAVGGYLGTPEQFPVGAGAGGYVNISTMGSCRPY